MGGALVGRMHAEQQRERDGLAVRAVEALEVLTNT